MSRKIRLLAALLVLCMCLGMLTACRGNKPGSSENPNGPGSSQNPSSTNNPGSTDEPGPSAPVIPAVTEFDPNAKYSYNTSASTLPSGWNPHTYQTADDAVYFDYTTDSLYTLFFNDPVHPQEGRESFDGYVIVPSMAADYPVDVTAQVRSAHPEFNIPASATSGYAWQVTLRDGLQWDDGTPITAQDFVDSLERVLRPELLNYRSSDYHRGTYAVVNAINYALQGQLNVTDNGTAGNQIEDMTVGADGQYMVDGKPVYVAVDYGIDYFEGDTLADYVNAYGDAYFSTTYWADLEALADENGLAPLNEETLGYLTDVITGNPAWSEDESYLYNYLVIVEGVYEANYSFDNVGLFATGDKTLTFVYANALEGFYLMTYAMSTGYLVKTDLYDSLLKETETASGSVWSSTYGTSLETSVSYGPYVMTDFQSDKLMHFSKNPNWWGWTSDVYTYVDPEDGNCYRMYETTDVDIQYVKEAATRKEMFLAGQMMTYGLQADDFDQYRNSEYYYTTPAETIYFLLFNGYEKVINEREAADDFDQTTTDLQVQMLESFRRACAVSIDRELMAATVSPQRSGGYGFLGTTFIYDPETAAYYRDSDQAKMALIDFYSIDLAKYNNDMDAAVSAITGYDPETAKVKFQEAYLEALDKGYITDANNDGISDQTVTMVYAMSGEVNDFLEKTFAFLNSSLNACAAGTGFEGKIAIVPSAPLGSAWSDNLRNGIMDTQLAGWSGSVLDPFGTADTWTDPNQSYWGNWFDANKYDLTIKIDGQNITMSVRQWALCLNGTMTTVGGKDYNFGYGQTSVDNRLTILAEIEKFMLTSYNCVPIMQNGSGFLLSQQVYYVVEDYNPMMSRGGIQYMKYNYSDAEWADYVASQGGTLQY